MPSVDMPHTVLLNPEIRTAFAVKVNEYVVGLRANYASLTLAQPEDQLKGPVGSLVVEAGIALGKAALFRTETKVEGVAGRPDLGIDVDNLPNGNVELKAPGNGSNPDRFRDKRSRDQWQRFKALPNLIYTDGRTWALYRYGEQVGEPVDLEVDVDAAGSPVTSARADDLLSLLAEFLGWSPNVPSTSRGLAQMLAPVSRLLRDEVLADIEAGGILKSLAAEWRATLFPDSNDAQFADGYAQTFTYALLLAQLEGAASPLVADAAASELDSDHALLAQALRVIAQHEIREAISMPVGLLERLIGAVDAERLSRTSDPWLYFYEDFLASYDPVQRNNRGVYYTPIELVEFQVRVANWALRERLGKPHGFGDDTVVALDPASGTGTYPLAIVSQTLGEALETGGAGLAAEIATTLAQNINAFEILVGPYAVTHLRLSRALQDFGADLPADGVKVFLTDTLSVPAEEGFANEVNIFQRKLAVEQERASKVKSFGTRVTAILGNPPWDRDSSGPATGGRRKGGMVRYSTEGNIGLLKAFLEPLAAPDRAEHSLSLYNDYVYFWRWAMWKALEQSPGPALISFVTASSYLSGPGFAGMREEFRRAFDEVWIVDLGGEGRGPRKSPNVFDGVMTPNAILMGIRTGEQSNRAEPALVRYRRVGGSKAEKLAFLRDVAGFEVDADWGDASSGWQASFIPPSATAYASWPALDLIFPWHGRGIQFSRSWPVSESQSALDRRWKVLVGASGAEQKELLKESRDAKADAATKSFLTGLKLPAISSPSAIAEPDGFRKIGFRAFDRQWAIADNRVIDQGRSAMWATASDEQIFFTTVGDGTTAGPAMVAHAYVPDLNATNNRGGLVYPLHREAGTGKSNVSSGLLLALSESYGRLVTAEEAAAYVFGLTGTAAFAKRFGSELASDGLRIPFTADSDLFEDVASFGADLLWWATFAERALDLDYSAPKDAVLPDGQAKVDRSVRGPGGGLPEWYAYLPSEKTLVIDGARVSPVSEAAWEFNVSGLKIIESWLGYRLRKRAGKTSSRLDEIRPDSWGSTGELLELLAVVEHLVAAEASASALLDRVETSTLLDEGSVDAPSEDELNSPSPISPNATMF